MALNGPNFAISEFFQHIEYDFLKEDHQNNFHTKIRNTHSGVWKLRPKTFKTVNFDQKWPNFGHKWPNFGHLKIFPAYTQ